jgi:hypothetical protein
MPLLLLSMLACDDPPAGAAATTESEVDPLDASWLIEGNDCVQIEQEGEASSVVRGQTISDWFGLLQVDAEVELTRGDGANDGGARVATGAPTGRLLWHSGLGSCWEPQGHLEALLPLHLLIDDFGIDIDENATARLYIWEDQSFGDAWLDLDPALAGVGADSSVMVHLEVDDTGAVDLSGFIDDELWFASPGADIPDDY